jgi:uncharacterized coiled-coil DUF342 family protein
MNMQIKRFNEQESSILDISNERVQEIMDEMGSYASTFEDKLEKIKNFERELSKFRSKSKKGNDQIDDSVIELQELIKSIEGLRSNLDNVLHNLEDYKESGREFIYK